MLNNLTYKQKNRALMVILALLIPLSYNMAFKKTWELYGECKETEEKLELAADAPSKMAGIKKRLQEIEAIAGKQQDSRQPAQQKLLGIITAWCQENRLVLKEMPNAINTAENDLLVETNVFEIEGSFSKLLNLIYQLEQKNNAGRVASVNFKTRKDYKTRQLILSATIYIQNIKKKANEVS